MSEEISEKPVKIKKKAKKPTLRSTQAQINQRVSQVQALLLEGFTRSYIQQFAAKKWKLTERPVDEYIAAATKIIKEVNSHTLQDNMAIISSQLWELFRKAKKKGDLSEQHKVLMSISKLKGLDQFTVNHIIEDKRELADMSDEELDRILAQENGQH